LSAPATTTAQPQVQGNIVRPPEYSTWTVKRQRDWDQQQFNNQIEEQRKIAAEQRSETGRIAAEQRAEANKIEEERRATDKKAIEEAKTNLNPATVQTTQDQISRTQNLINELAVKGRTAYEGLANSITGLENIPAFNELRAKYLPTDQATALRNIEPLFYKLAYSHMEASRAAGMPSDMFKTDADVRNYFKTVLATNQGPEAFYNGLSKLQEDIAAEQNRIKLANTNRLDLLKRTGNLEQERVLRETGKLYEGPPEQGGDGQWYRKRIDGSYELVKPPEGK